MDENDREDLSDVDEALDQEGLTVFEPAEAPFGTETQEPANHVEFGRGLTASERLQDAFGHAPAECVDIMSQLGGSAGTFCVHAESLLLHLALDPQYRVEFNENPQFLRFLFYVERLLNSLAECGGSYRLVFFDCYRRVMDILCPGLWTLRQCLLLMCKASSFFRFSLSLVGDAQCSDEKRFDFRVFSDWYDPEFAAFLNDWQPPFMLLDDGSTWAMEKAEGDAEQDAEEDAEEEAESNEVAVPLEMSNEVAAPLALMAFCAAFDVHCAMLFDLERKGRKVFAFVPFVAWRSELMVDARKVTEDLRGAACSDKDTDHATYILDILNKAATGHFSYVGIREMAALYLLKENCAIVAEDDEGLKLREMTVLLVKTLLISFFCARTLPLAERCLTDCQSQWEFLDTARSLLEFFLVESGAFMDVVVAAERVESLPLAAAHCADFMDYRLANWILVLIAQGASSSDSWKVDAGFFGLPEGVVDELNSALESACPGERLFPIDLTLLRDDLGEGPHDDVGGRPVKPLTAPQVLPVQSKLLEKILHRGERPSTNGIELPGVEVAADSRVVTDEVFNTFFKKRGGVFREDHLVDVAELEIKGKGRNPALEAKLSQKDLERYKTEAERERVKRRRELKMLQKGALRVHRLATSIAGIAGYQQPVVPIESHPWKAAAGAVDEKSESVPPGDGRKGGQTKVDGRRKEKTQSTQTTSVAATAKGKAVGGALGGGKKVSTKAEAIIKQNEEAQKAKALKLDADRLPVFLHALTSAAAKATSPARFLRGVLDVVVGPGGATEELGAFEAVTTTFKTAEAQTQVLTRTMDLLWVAMTITFKHVKDSEKQDMHRLCCFAFQFVHQVFRTYKAEWGVEEIRRAQSLLVALGFVKSSLSLFEAWCRQKEKQRRVLQEGPSGTAKAGGKTGKSHQSGKRAVDTGKENGGSKLLGNQQQLRDALVAASVVQKTAFAVPEGMEAEVQLKFMGHQMERSLGSAADPRVRYKPDLWQKRLLDIIDERRSALVCAPTGCGKTFIGYFAMERVLSFDNDSVVVFVCPSKALVQQVEFEIAARFRKDYPVGTYPTSATVLSGSMLNEVHKKPLECQILLTVPSLLEMLLMSSAYRAWVGKLKYIILDEIHCIGDSEEGREWERLLQLMPCPFLAFSATVGNPDSFHDWLSRAHVSGQDSRLDGKPAVEIVQFHERYADLSTCVYSQSISVKEGVLKSVEAPRALSGSSKAIAAAREERLLPITGGLYALNPFVCLVYKQVLAEGVPSDFYVPSADLLLAYYTLRNILAQDTENGQATLLSPTMAAEVQFFQSELRPGSYFRGVPAVSKKQYRYYLQTFKHSLVFLIQGGVITENVFNRFVSDLVIGKSLQKTGKVLSGTLWQQIQQIDCVVSVEPLHSSIITSRQRSCGPVVPNDEAVLDTGRNLRLILTENPTKMKPWRSEENMLEFVRSLDTLGLLPALMFNFSRHEVDQLGRGLLNILAKQQHAKYYGDEAKTATTRAINKKRKEDYRALLKQREQLEKMRSLSKEEKAEQGIGEVDLEAELAVPPPPPPVDIAEEFDPEFSFCNARVRVSQKAEIEDIVRSIVPRGGASVRRSPIKEWLLEALERGIGIHHAGCGRHYRAAVEMLFRMGLLRVVFSTETLALGINMPCKSTVFIGDSLQLTPLLYRQTSGRAGRRGFDTFGHIVFWDVPFPKIRRLLCSRLPVLSGEFPISPTVTCRAVQLDIMCHRLHKDRMAAELNKPTANIRKIMEEAKTELNLVASSLERLFRVPLFSVSGMQKASQQESQRLDTALLYSLRFSTDMLRQCRLLTEEGTCEGLAGLYSLLYKTEPCNDVLNWLFLHGIVHDMVEKEIANDYLPPGYPVQREFQKDEGYTAGLRRATALVLLLAYFVCRKRLCHNVLLGMRRDSDFRPLLPPMADALLGEVAEQERFAIRNAADYIQALVLSEDAAVSQSEGCILPVSKLRFQTELPKPCLSPLFDQLQSLSFACPTHAPFAALRGRESTDFVTADEMVLNIVSGIYFERAMVPTLKPRSVNLNKKVYPLLSNYALDFLIHGKLAHVVSHSALDKNVAWNTLMDFQGAFENIQVIYSWGLPGGPHTPLLGPQRYIRRAPVGPIPKEARDKRIWSAKLTEKTGRLNDIVAAALHDAHLLASELMKKEAA